MIASAILAVSLFNAVLLVWLGLTVLLNAERRSWGLLLTGAALLTGGAFFLLHASVAGRGLTEVTWAVHLQWPVGWFIGLALSLAWYATMLWHAGFWQQRGAPPRRRHLPGLVGTLVLAGGVVVLIALAAPQPATWAGDPSAFARPAIGRIPLLAIAYPFVVCVCVVLALDALRHPSPSPRLMGDVARLRARPWLVATSVVLLLVGVLVGAMMIGAALGGPQQIAAHPSGRLPLVIVRADLAVSLLIAVSVLFLGQAVVAYEIFTGKTLPRRGLRRYWRNAILLAAGYSALTAWSVAAQSTQLYGLLLAALLVTVFYALFNWRSYVERDRYIEHLRPFVTSPRVYDALLRPDAHEVNGEASFRVLCADVLGARVAYLTPAGALASLAGPPLAYPSGGSPPSRAEDVATQCTSTETLCLAVDPDAHGGAMWAVPLWGQRGLIGVLWLGEKADGGLYTQEEIEIARASGERMIDTAACAHMAQRLMALQRQRLVESQVVDGRIRRVLHDDVLPTLHALMLALREPGRSPGSEPLAELAAVHRQLSDVLRQMPAPGGAQLLRLGLIRALRGVVEQDYAHAFDEVTWDVDPRAEEEAQALPPLGAEVVFHAAREAIRNAARHARGDEPARAVHLRVAAAWRDGLEVVIEDDGVGVAAGGEPDGAQRGVALHSTMMAVIGGEWIMESVPGQSTHVTLRLPEVGG